MRNKFVAVGILAGSLMAAPAFAQHTAPNQQPATATAPAAPTGDLPLGTVHLTKAVTADGKPLPAGTYQVRLTAQEAKPDAVGASKNVEREMREMKQGKLKSGRSGKKVTNPKQAIAIGLSEARRAGKKVPPNPNE